MNVRPPNTVYDEFVNLPLSVLKEPLVVFAVEVHALSSLARVVQLGLLIFVRCSQDPHYRFVQEEDIVEAVDLVLFIKPSANVSLCLILFHVRRVGIYALEILHYAQLLALIDLLVVLN